MTTIGFELQNVGFFGGAPSFNENDYSIHLNGKMSPEELRSCMSQLNDIIRVNLYSRMWIWFVVLTMVLSWTVYCVIVIEFMHGFSWFLFVICMVVSYVPLIIWIVVYRRSINNIRTKIAERLAYFNTQYNRRNLNWRMKQMLSAGTDRRYRGYLALSVELEIAGIPYQVPMYIDQFAPPPQYNANVPQYNANVPQYNANVPQYNTNIQYPMHQPLLTSQV